MIIVHHLCLPVIYASSCYLIITLSYLMHRESIKKKQQQSPVKCKGGGKPGSSAKRAEIETANNEDV